MVSSRVQNFVSENAQRALDFSAQLDQESMELAYKLDERRSSQIKNAKWDYWSSSAYHRFRHWDPTNHLLDDLEDEYKSTLLEDQLMLNSTGGLRGLDGYVGRIGRRWSSRPELPSNICRYFNRGFCKNGRHCRFLHEDPCSMLSPSGNELDEHIISPQSLEELEVEIIELLKSRRRNPVSIASLPMLYYDKYGKGLQAEGYLTESQRHGKVGYSLTKLLARLKNSIRLIDKPNGQHSVILAEDVPKYIEYFGEKEDTGAAGSRQIYLTFPPDSSFTEKDVSDYFENFGPVQDVRIPCQEKRMFGFVTFVHPETVQEILSKDSSHHYVCGARILAKRYREKTRPSYRKQSSKYQRQMDCQKIQFLRACESIRMRQVMEVQKRAFEQEQISMMETLPEHLIQSAYFGRNGISSTQTHLAEQEESQYPSAGLLTHLLDSKNPTVSVDDNNVPQDDTIRPYILYCFLLEKPEPPGESILSFGKGVEVHKQVRRSATNFNIMNWYTYLGVLLALTSFLAMLMQTRRHRKIAIDIELLDRKKNELAHDFID